MSNAIGPGDLRWRGRSGPGVGRSYDAAMSDAAAAPATSSTENRDGAHLAHRLLLTVSVLALVGTVLGLMLVQRVGVTYRDGLEIAADGAEVAALSVEQASSVVDELAGLAAAVSVALDQAETVLESTADSLENIGDAMSNNVADSIEGVAEIANGLAGFIETVERFIPGNSDSLAESLRQVSDGLEPTPDQLRVLAGQLSTTAGQLRATAVSLQPIGNQVDALADSIGNSQEALDRVDGLATDIQTRTEAALERSETDLWLLRLLVVVIGLGTAAACWAGARAVRHLARPSPTTAPTTP